MIDVSSIDKSKIDLDSEFTSLRIKGNVVRIPLLFNSEKVIMTEELRNVNLRWVMIYVKWIRRVEVEEGGYFSPVIITDNCSGYWGAEDPLGVLGLEQHYPGLKEFSNKAYLLMNGTYDFILFKGNFWLNRKLYSISIDTREGYKKGLPDNDKVQSRLKLDQYITDTIMTPLNHVRKSLNQSYNIYPMISGGRHSRDFIFEEDALDKDVIIDTDRNSFYIRMRGSLGESLYAVARVDLDSIKFTLNRYDVYVEVDPYEGSRNEWFFIHLLENHLRRNVKNTFGIINSLRLIRGRYNHLLESVNEGGHKVTPSSPTKGHFNSFSFTYKGESYKIPYPFIVEGEPTGHLREYNNVFAKAFLAWFERLQGSVERVKNIDLHEELLTEMPFCVFSDSAERFPVEPIYYPLDKETREFLGDEIDYFHLVMKLITCLRNTDSKISNYFGPSQSSKLKYINPAVFKRESKSVEKTSLNSFNKVEEYIKCQEEGCNCNEKSNRIICTDYGFFCIEHFEDNLISCPHCNEVTEKKRNHCDHCNNDITGSFYRP